MFQVFFIQVSPAQGVKITRFMACFGIVKNVNVAIYAHYAMSWTSMIFDMNSCATVSQEILGKNLNHKCFVRGGGGVVGGWMVVRMLTFEKYFLQYRCEKKKKEVETKGNGLVSHRLTLA